jgi:hypothetical protein
VMNIHLSYNILLWRFWIHDVGIVASSLHHPYISVWSTLWMEYWW